MTKTKVFAHKNHPFGLPIWQTAIIYLYLDRWQVSQLVWGIVGTVVVLWWILSIVTIIWLQETVELKELK